MFSSRIIIIIAIYIGMNLLSGYFAYQILLKDIRLSEELFLKQEANIIQKLITHDIKNLIFNDHNTNDLVLIDNVSYSKCNIDEQGVEITYNSIL